MSVEDLRTQGNALFSERKYTEAIDVYTKAIVLDKSSSVLFSNRSAAYLGLGDYISAKDDAERALQLDAAAVKAHYRLALALRGLSDYGAALSAARRGLGVDPGNRALLALTKELLEKARETDKGEKESKLDVLASGGVRSNIYSELLRILRVVDSGVSSSSNRAAASDLERHPAVMLNGVYKSLIDPIGFKETLYPGVAARDLIEAPKDLFELLRRGSAVRHGVEVQLADIAQSAVSILEGVCKKGATKGEIMESSTESALCVQIAGESLARSVVTTVRALNRRASAAFSERWAEEARPEAAGDGDLELLDEDVLADLFGPKRICVQNEFLGGGWPSLVASDLERFRRTQPMTAMDADSGPATCGKTPSPSSSPSLIAWIDLPLPSPPGSSTAIATSVSVLEQFPALAEAVRCLHALPFTCNAYLSRDKKQASGEGFRLPSRGATALVYVPRGAPSRQLVLDNGTSRNDFGISLVIVPAAPSEDKEQEVPAFMYSYLSDAANTDTIPMANDRLFVHHSSEVLTGRTANTSTGMYILSFYIHGPKHMRNSVFSPDRDVVTDKNT